MTHNPLPVLRSLQKFPPTIQARLRHREKLIDACALCAVRGTHDSSVFFGRSWSQSAGFSKKKRVLGNHLSLSASNLTKLYLALNWNRVSSPLFPFWSCCHPYRTSAPTLSEDEKGFQMRFPPM